MVVFERQDYSLGKSLKAFLQDLEGDSSCIGSIIVVWRGACCFFKDQNDNTNR